MAFVNYNNREITAKIVYYGPALSGKTTCLRYIYGTDEVENKGKLITLDTDGDRTLFFDFLPLEIGRLGNYSVKIQLYTVPGQVSYDTTRKLVLQGADGVVFVADSQVVARELNVESLGNLKKNLKLNSISFQEIPLIFQYNKRDLKEILPIELLNKDLNPENKSFFPTVATTGENVLEGLHSIIKLVMIFMKNKLSIFQKDKTVMFSHDEITSASPPSSDKKTAVSIPDKTDPEVIEPPVPVAEPEEIFELSSPLGDKENVFIPAVDDDVFELENPKETEEDKSITPIPHFDLDVKPMDRFQTQTPYKQKPSETIPLKAKPVPESPSNQKEVELPPIRLTIPDFHEEICITLKTQIILKKEKKR